MSSRLLRATTFRLLLLSGLLAIGALLGACASGSGSRDRTPSAATAPRALSRNSPTASQAVAFARAVNLTAADVPGFTSSSAHEAETAQEQRLQRRLRACIGPAGFAAGLAAERSPSFKVSRDILELGVSSEVAVARSSTVAASELAAIRGGRIRACLSRYLNLLLQSRNYRGAQLRPVSIASGTPPAPGATGSFGWRITASFAVNRFRLSLYVDILGFVLGPARVTLVSSGALRPFPAPIQQRLYSLLLARASARAP
jgi:hypothetical protein